MSGLTVREAAIAEADCPRCKVPKGTPCLTRRRTHSERIHEAIRFELNELAKERLAPAAVVVACVACGRVVRARKNGHPYRHTPKTRLTPRRVEPTYCDGSLYAGVKP